MIRYLAAAMALKVFSSTSLTRRAYRALGNSAGGRKRSTGRMQGYYLERVKRMLDLADRFGVPKDGDKIVELGTGWLHWEAITTRLFFDVHGVLYDVWDNRQMDGLKNYLRQFDGMLPQLEVEESRRQSARRMIARILDLDDYRDLYRLLGFEYRVDPSGSLGTIEKGVFDLVVSAGVMEHIPAGDASQFVHGISSLLKPGGHSVHSINIRDHLRQYDRSLPQKQYLRYSDRAWRIFFENDVQYINRIQRSDWIRFFQDAGLVLDLEVAEDEDLRGLKIAGKYAGYADADLRCGGLRIVHHKPA